MTAGKRVPGSRIRLEFSAKGAPPVYLNHVVVIPDPATFSAIGRSQFLRTQFAGFTEGTVKAEGNDSWSGFYLMGRRTYLEILRANPSKKQNEGDYGLGLCIEEEDGLGRIAALLRRATRGNVRRHVRKRRFGDREVPWFRVIDVRRSKPADSSGLWVMEYLQSYMDEFKRQDSDSVRGPRVLGISRERYNAPMFSPERFFEDIKMVELALDRKQSIRVAGELRAVGYGVHSSGDMMVCVGPDATLKISPAAHGPTGIRMVKMSLLKHVKRRAKYRLGARATLTLAGKTAILRF